MEQFKNALRCVFFTMFIALVVSSCGRSGSRQTSRVGQSTHSRSAQSNSTIAQQNRSSSRSSSRGQQQSSNVPRREMSGAEIFQKYNTAVFVVYNKTNKGGCQGSGFFISDDGLAVSNHHVFEGAKVGLEEIKLPKSGKVYKISEVVTYSEEYDFFLFKVDLKGDKVNYIPIANIATPSVGSKAYAIGSPIGLENTFSSGEISQIRDSGAILQISVPIDSGSSGGALLNSYGEVIGITTSGYTTSGANLNFAMNINLIKTFIE